MAELTAQMIERGRHAGAGDVARRRKTAQDVRTARERLTSSSGLDRASEVELVRLFAESHRASAPLLLGLAGAVAAVASRWLPVGEVAVWGVVMVGALGTVLILSQGFLGADLATVKLGRWRRLFAAGEFQLGLAWALAVDKLAAAEGGASGFALFVTLVVGAVTATLSATIPAAVLLGLAPLALAVGKAAFLARDVGSGLTLAMTGGALLFFLFLADRLRRSALSSIRARAEKDAVLIELEEAKANSDEARRRAEEANLAKSRFLATMSHELRTPLNAIMGFSEVMKNEVFGPHAFPAYKDYAADIHGSGQHLLNLIDEILDLSRIEAGRYELAEEAIQLGWIVDECRHMTTLRAKAKGQTVKALVDPSLPRLWADERAVRQIVLNVLSNAIKFTPGGGEIVVKVGWTSSGGQYVSVKDSGPGIPEDEIPVVLSSFGRGTLAIKTAEQGSGLGLPIVKGLVDLHGGGFQIRSKPREGAEVIVTFPAARVMDAMPAVDVPEPARKAA